MRLASLQASWTGGPRDSGWFVVSFCRSTGYVRSNASRTGSGFSIGTAANPAGRSIRCRLARDRRDELTGGPLRSISGLESEVGSRWRTDRWRDPNSSATVGDRCSPQIRFNRHSQEIRTARNSSPNCCRFTSQVPLRICQCGRLSYGFADSVRCEVPCRQPESVFSART